MRKDAPNNSSNMSAMSVKVIGLVFIVSSRRKVYTIILLEEFPLRTLRLFLKYGWSGSIPVSTTATTTSFFFLLKDLHASLRYIDERSFVGLIAQLAYLFVNSEKLKMPLASKLNIVR